MNIYFSDLNKDCQERLLKLKRIESPEEMNWDVFPLFEIPQGDYEEEVILENSKE